MSWTDSAAPRFHRLRRAPVLSCQRSGPAVAPVGQLRRRVIVERADVTPDRAGRPVCVGGARKRPPPPAVARGRPVPMTAGRPPQGPHCPARTCTEYARPDAAGRTAAAHGRRRGRWEGRARRAPRRRWCGPPGGSAHVRGSRATARQPFSRRRIGTHSKPAAGWIALRLLTRHVTRNGVNQCGCGASLRFSTCHCCCW